MDGEGGRGANSINSRFVLRGGYGVVVRGKKSLCPSPIRIGRRDPCVRRSLLLTATFVYWKRGRERSSVHPVAVLEELVPGFEGGSLWGRRIL